jgi:hypothetical protein
MQVSNEIIQQIADNLEIGLKCFIHKETFELVLFPEEDPDEEEWREDIEKLDKEPDNYLEIGNMSSEDSFRLMEEFVQSVEDFDIQSRLMQAIQGHKPFANFKHQIHQAGAFRQRWFDFKKMKLIEWVQNQLESEDD